MFVEKRLQKNILPSPGRGGIGDRIRSLEIEVRRSEMGVKRRGREECGRQTNHG